MIYAYHCDACGHAFDVVKPVSEYNAPELCERKACGAPARREPFPRRTFLHGTSVLDAEYNPGLGCIVKSAEHRREIAKQKGLEEIGNEPPEAIHKHFDTRREEQRERQWAETTEKWVGDGT